ncbi:hypothetical protein KAR91_85090 [Candidatus Pacearchaeota archaeon]|nr:hypothetical protein [Candidatus Pacearchaeota archaeon]
MKIEKRCEFCGNHVSLLRKAGIQVVEANGHHICKNCAKKLKSDLPLDTGPSVA